MDLDFFKNTPEDDAKINEVFAGLRLHYEKHKDPWGFNIDLCEKTLRKLVPIYRKYFKVRVFGQENVENIPYIVVSNHTGQLPIDGMLITIAFLLDIAPPRVLRAMIERFMAQLPFMGDMTAQLGSILGDRANCEYLIDHNESILVFPEGVRGISKNTPDYYKVRSFSQGFFRIALQKKTPILPLCVIGAEEMFPFVFHATKLARAIGLPSLPLTPLAFPLPSPIDIYIGKAYQMPDHLNPESPEKEIKEHIYHIENRVRRMIAVGMKKRRPFVDSVRVPLSKYIIKELRRKDD